MEARRVEEAMAGSYGLQAKRKEWARCPPIWRVKAKRVVFTCPLTPQLDGGNREEWRVFQYP